MSENNETAILTPCINVCVIDNETGQCIGCGRTRPEIGDWMRMSTDERRAIMDELPERVATLTKRKTRKGGSRARRARTKPIKINF